MFKADPVLTMWAASGNQTVSGFAKFISKGNMATDGIRDREASQGASFQVALDQNAGRLY
jgi:hypothetical protein